MKRILFILLGIVLVIIIGFVLFVITSAPKNYNQEYPISDLKVEPDSARLARGEYLVYGPAHCGHCHSPVESLPDIESGVKVPLTGGFGLEIPPGKFNAPNITPDPETGIGRYSDGELYRMMRYNITPSGHAAFDFMPFVNMADEDIYSIIAYLRAQKPVKHEMPPVELTFLGKMIYAMDGILPGVPDNDIPEKVKEDTTALYGKYLAYAVANCRGCHTERDLKSGKYLGEDYAGGFVFEPDNLSNGWQFVTPNLTPDAETGIMANWTEEQFIARMRKGRVHEYSAMPWMAVSQMKEDDLKAVYRYLHTLSPVKNEVAQTAIAPK